MANSGVAPSYSTVMKGEPRARVDATPASGHLRRTVRSSKPSSRQPLDASAVGTAPRKRCTDEVSSNICAALKPWF